MDRVIYVGMVGAKEVEYRQNINANNIANASNDGFLASIASTRSLVTVGDGLNSRAYAMTSSMGVDLTDSGIKFTGNKSDLTVQGQGWFQVLDVGSGDLHLKKNLKLAVSSSGLVVDASGAAIVGVNGEIMVPVGSSLEFGENGDVYVSFPEQEELIRIATLSVVEAEQVKIDSRGRYVSAETVLIQNPSVVQGALKLSNVNVVSESVESMSLNSQYQLNMKIFDSAKKMADSTSKLLGN